MRTRVRYCPFCKSALVVSEDDEFYEILRCGACGTGMHPENLLRALPVARDERP